MTPDDIWKAEEGDIIFEEFNLNISDIGFVGGNYWVKFHHNNNMAIA